MGSHWYNTFDAVFFTGIATMIIGLAGLAIKYGFASKCDNVSICCGLLKIHRAVQLETNIEESTELQPTQEEQSPPERI